MIHWFSLDFGCGWCGIILPPRDPKIYIYIFDICIYIYFIYIDICIYSYTLQGINISHLGKRKIIFKMPFLGDMLVSWRVFTSCCISIISKVWRFLKFGQKKTKNQQLQRKGVMTGVNQPHLTWPGVIRSEKVRWPYFWGFYKVWKKGRRNQALFLGRGTFGGGNVDWLAIIISKDTKAATIQKKNKQRSDEWDFCWNSPKFT